MPGKHKVVWCETEMLTPWRVRDAEAFLLVCGHTRLWCVVIWQLMISELKPGWLLGFHLYYCMDKSGRERSPNECSNLLTAGGESQAMA